MKKAKINKKSDLKFGDLRPLKEEKGIFISPEKNRFPEKVLFVGGHANFTKKIKGKYPAWTFLDTVQRNGRGVKKDYDLIVVATAHLSHSIMEVTAASVSSRVPIVYVKSTNLKLMEEEIMQGLENRIAV